MGRFFKKMRKAKSHSIYEEPKIYKNVSLEEIFRRIDNSGLPEWQKNIIKNRYKNMPKGTIAIGKDDF